MDEITQHYMIQTGGIQYYTVLHRVMIVAPQTSPYLLVRNATLSVYSKPPQDRSVLVNVCSGVFLLCSSVR